LVLTMLITLISRTLLCSRHDLFNSYYFPLLFRLSFLYSLLQQGVEKSDMEIRDVKTTCVKRDLCTALGNQHFCVCKIYVREHTRRLATVLCTWEHTGHSASSPDHWRFWGSDSRGPRNLPYGLQRK
jgi:hypothetical protein